MVSLWCSSNLKYHRTDAKCSQLPTTLTPDFHMQNQPEMGFMLYPSIVSPAVGMPGTYLGLENSLLTVISHDFCVQSRSVGIYMQVPSAIAIATSILKSANKI